MRTHSVVLSSLTAAVLGVSGLVACSSSSDSTAASNAAVTNVTETPVTDQGQTGNCWLYATAGWVESLHSVAEGNSVHYSPAYWFYWDLYEQLTGGSTDAEYGGYWGLAGDIIKSYGLLPAGAFAIDDVATQEAAIDALNKAITAGSLPLNAAGGRDGAMVRAALDSAFKLGKDQSALLTDIFGADGTSTFLTGAVASGGIVSAQSFQVTTPVYGKAAVTTTLDQVIGTAATGATATPDDRTGSPLAWTAIYPPSVPGYINMMVEDAARPGHRGALHPRKSASATTDGGTTSADAGLPLVNGNDDGGALPPIPTISESTWRPMLQRIQRAMNDGAPLPMAWMVNDDNINKYGSFVKGQTVMPMSVSGGHEVLLSDYQISNVPGFGTLKAGTVATPEELAASLSDQATVDFIRVKNSWGDFYKDAPQQGYDDVYMGYLMQPTYWCDDVDGADKNGDEDCYPVAPEMWDVVLPPGY